MRYNLFNVFFTVLFTGLFLFANMAQAQEVPTPINPPPVPAPVDPIAGHWKISSRTCASGAPVRDNFMIGRDDITLSFHNGQYDGKTQVGGCTIWVTGKYTTQDHMLRVFNVNGASNCQPQPSFASVTNFFDVVDSELKIYINSNQYNSSCPTGDMLESVYTRIGQ